MAKPPSGSGKPPTRKQMAQMAEAAMMGGSGHGGDTFLTESLMVGAKKGAKKAGKATFSTAAKPKLKSGSSMGGGGRAEDFDFYEE